MPHKAPRRADRLSALAVVGSAFVLAARLNPGPALVDAVTGAPLPGARLVFPLSHLALTPLSTAADLAVCSSVEQILSFLLFTAALGLPLRWGYLAHGADEWWGLGSSSRAFGVWLACVLGFSAWAALVPRAAPKLVLADPDLIAVDFHSHSARSWDGRARFTPSRNIEFHEAAGFGAGFLTDHNTVAGLEEARELSARRRRAGRSDYLSLDGQELSLEGAHVVVIGSAKPIDPAGYGGFDGLKRLLAQAWPVYGGLALLSLPEYWRHHDERLAELATSGAAGLEIFTSSPKALRFPEPARRRAVELCRSRGMFLAGATDNHGYGSSSCVWSLMRLPGWRGLDSGPRQDAVLARLRSDGFSAVTVARRARPAGAAGSDGWLDFPLAYWAAARAWTPAQSLVVLGWFWIPAVLARRRKMR